MNTSALSEVFSSLAPATCSIERERAQTGMIIRLERDSLERDSPGNVTRQQRKISRNKAFMHLIATYLTYTIPLFCGSVNKNFL